MDSNSKILGPSKTPPLINSNTSQNSNPNISPTPELNSSMSPVAKSSASKNPNQITSSPSRKTQIRERKLKSKRERANHSAVMCPCKDKAGETSKRCACVAYTSLRTSHEEFLKNQSDRAENALKEEDHGSVETPDDDQIEKKVEYIGLGEMGIKRTRDKVLDEEDPREKQILDSGSGRVKLLVQVFERLATKSEAIYDKQSDEDKKETKWALPDDSLSSFSPTDFQVTSESLGLDSQHSSSSIDSSQGRLVMKENKWKRKQQQKLKPTCQKPFKLKTEERGRIKEEELMKKVKQAMEEEEKLRIHIAQGVPWTTDQPESLVKPPSKEITNPVDVKLHSDSRAVERAEFNQQVFEKIGFMDQYKIEREREQMLAEEEEIRQLRKELVPKAQPMPYFDRPFVPKRSEKKPTVPRDPKLNTQKESHLVTSNATSLN